MGIAGFVLGILSVLCSLFGLYWAAVIIGSVGIVLSAVAKRKSGGGLTTAGLVLSIVGTALAVLSLMAVVVLLSWAKETIGHFIS